jgi:hypothetical protein
MDRATEPEAHRPSERGQARGGEDEEARTRTRTELNRGQPFLFFFWVRGCIVASKLLNFCQQQTEKDQEVTPHHTRNTSSEPNRFELNDNKFVVVPTLPNEFLVHYSTMTSTNSAIGSIHIWTQISNILQLSVFSIHIISTYLEHHVKDHRPYSYSRRCRPSILPKWLQWSRDLFQRQWYER